MEYIVIGTCVVVVAAICITAFIKKKTEVSRQFITDEKVASSGLVPKEDSSQELVIQMEMLPADANLDESRLVEITDSKVLAHANNLVPGLAQAGNAANIAVQAVQANGEVLYRAIIPAGAKLTDSRAMENAVRGIYHGADGIKGHANLVTVEAQKGTAVVTNTAAAAMGVVSMVVGQYYMTQINAEFGVISDDISKIADFQAEILENNELRMSKINQLDSLEEECTQLLGQVNLTLAGYAKKKDLDYDAYEKQLKVAQN